MDAIIGAGKMTEKDTPDVYIQTYGKHAAGMAKLANPLASQSGAARIIENVEAKR